MRQSIVVKTFIVFVALAAIGGAVVWGMAQSTEVRGSSETAVQEPVARVEDTHVPVPAAAGETEDWRAYMLRLPPSMLTDKKEPRLMHSGTMSSLWTQLA